MLCLVSAFVVTLITIPPIISLIRKYKLYDKPNARKEHITPIPTMGGIAIIAGMACSLFLWFPFSTEPALISFFFSVILLFGLGIMDDLKDLSAKYKFIIQIALALLIAISGIRINSFGGLFGIDEIPVQLQFTITVLAIVGITNAFNLIDGIDGLAGGLGFMSLVTLGIFLIMNRDGNTALIAFALAGGILAFLYFNFNPAKIFMGDTGSLAIGGGFAAVSVFTRTELLMLIVAGLFLIITLSVVLQVGYFKATKGKRLFKMAPLQHHFELLGWAEITIVIRFWIICGLCVALGLGIFYAEWTVGLP